MSEIRDKKTVEEMDAIARKARERDALAASAPAGGVRLDGRPSRCPVCGGNGLMPNGYYGQTTGVWTAYSTAPEKCRSCDGRGYVWLEPPAPADAREAERERVIDWRGLLTDAKFGMDQAIGKQHFWECDCEPTIEYDTNACIHQESCAVLLEGHFEATADWIRMALDAAASPESAGLFPDMPEPMRSIVLPHLDASPESAEPAPPRVEG